MRQTKYLFIVLALLLTSCVTSKKYTEKIKSWEGEDVNRLINSWGPPSDVFEMPNGNKMYTWLYVSNSLVTTNYNSYLNRLESRQIQYWCKTTFTANTKDVIINWRWNGNACKSK